LALLAGEPTGLIVIGNYGQSLFPRMIGDKEIVDFLLLEDFKFDFTQPVALASDQERHQRGHIFGFMILLRSSSGTPARRNSVSTAPGQTE
jgi:hypothetical protein